MMDDYISKTEAFDIVRYECGEWSGLAKTIGKRFDELLSADVVDVVRCRDCKFGCYDIGDRGMYCGRKNVRLDTYEDDYCSFAERKDGEQKERW